MSIIPRWHSYSRHLPSVWGTAGTKPDSEGSRRMEHHETLQSHVLRVLAHSLRLGASQTVVSWYSNKMLDSAIELEAQATGLEEDPYLPSRDDASRIKAAHGRKTDRR